MAKKTKEPAARKPAAKPSSRKAMKRSVQRNVQAPKRAKPNKPRTPKSAKHAPIPGPKGKPPQKATPPPRGNPLAQRMAAFSKTVVEEEEAPVAVRTFNEARAGVEQSKQLNVKSGSVTPVEGTDEPEDEELAEFEEVERPPAREPQRGRPVGAPPQMEPLTGKLAVPKTTQHDEFQLAAPAPKGKKGAPPTKDDLGKIELRMQRGTTDKTVARASPDYLQRSFNKAAQSGKTSAAPTASEKDKEDKFDVAMDKPERQFDASLTDFGDVEIAQQTRKGKRTLGTLDAGDEKENDS